MDEIDKKIEKAKGEIAWLEEHRKLFGQDYTGEWNRRCWPFWELIIALNELKKCREELEPWLKSHSRAQMLIDLSDKWKKEIGQRTKDAIKNNCAKIEAKQLRWPSGDWYLPYADVMRAIQETEIETEL